MSYYNVYISAIWEKFIKIAFQCNIPHFQKLISSILMSNFAIYFRTKSLIITKSLILLWRNCFVKFANVANFLLSLLMLFRIGFIHVPEIMSGMGNGQMQVFSDGKKFLARNKSKGPKMQNFAKFYTCLCSKNLKSHTFFGLSIFFQFFSSAPFRHT